MLEKELLISKEIESKMEFSDYIDSIKQAIEF
jgi:hypothetical protein